jgi:hypothetical protein
VIPHERLPARGTLIVVGVFAAALATIALVVTIPLLSQVRVALDPVTVTACATVAPAVVGLISIVANDRLIRTSIDQANAPRDVINETIRDRELAHRPVLTFVSPFYDPLSDSNAWTSLGTQMMSTAGRQPLSMKPLDVRIANIGRGLAEECHFCARVTPVEEGMPRRADALSVSDRFPMGFERIEPLATTANQLVSRIMVCRLAQV